MKYKVIIGCHWETNDMGIANHGSSQKEVPIENIVPGYDLFSLYHESPGAPVESFEDGRLVFRFHDQTVTVEPGHIWNSPMFRKYNPYIYEAEGYTVDILIDNGEKEADNEADTPQYEDVEKNSRRVLALIKKMRKNADQDGSPVWKNIPLAREMFDILHNKLPIDGEEIDAAGVRFCCDIIFLQHLLNERDVPRLCLEFLQLRKRANDLVTEYSWKFDPDNIMSYKEVEDLINRLDFYIDPNVTMTWWVEYVHAHLLFDPVERTPEWEEIIYDVEKAVDRRLKRSPRGMGFCFEYWSVKQEELSKRGIEWRTPHQMNPRVMFD